MPPAKFFSTPCTARDSARPMTENTARNEEMGTPMMFSAIITDSRSSKMRMIARRMECMAGATLGMRCSRRSKASSR